MPHGLGASFMAMTKDKMKVDSILQVVHSMHRWRPRTPYQSQGSLSQEIFSCNYDRQKKVTKVQVNPARFRALIQHRKGGDGFLPKLGRNVVPLLVYDRHASVPIIEVYKEPIRIRKSASVAKFVSFTPEHDFEWEEFPGA